MTVRVRALYCFAFLLFALSGNAAQLRIGMRLADALEALRDDGMPLVYSSDLIAPDMRITWLPDNDDQRAVLDQLLAPWRLTTQIGPDDTLLIVRMPARPSASAATEPPPARDIKAPRLPDELIVSASRYRFLRQNDPSRNTFSAVELQADPEIGNDPLRAIARLPGGTRNDFSARTNARGGGADENLILLDGVRLYDPFHLKDFQGLFSSVDARLIDTMDVYMGGFPARYGGRMSSVTDLQTVQPDASLYREVTASFFNLSGLAAGQSADNETRWLVSARRGNLDQVLNVLDPKLGEPRYFDVNARLSHAFSEAFTLTGNVRGAKDNIRIADSDEEEFATGKYRDEYYWLRATINPGDDLQGTVLLSRTKLSGFRTGIVDKEGAASGMLSENNSFRITTLATDWNWNLSNIIRVNFGGEFRDESGSYDYAD
ncbi:MAG: TonB-dependent receptor plug domain-containing protein, partial [Gammaproteobacteria bacterium]|nr:TonB-dependent receptor plug domain-containing protein [Gammaproteobacteria bacterium]